MEREGDLLNLAVAACEAAGRVITASRPGTVTAEVKGHGDWVTAVDREAEAAALAILRAGTPDIPILAEESGGVRADRLWVVDPLDGTTNFVRGFPMVGVSIALLSEGEPYIGVVGAPQLGERWQAVRGGGAHDVRGRRLNIQEGAARGVTATGFPFRLPQRRDAYLRVMNRTLAEMEDLRRPGAASLDLAYVAAGSWSGFFELGLALWDIAAGALLVREAGGTVTDWSGDPRAVLESGDILAGNPAWHALMQDLCSEV
ncbi:MAG: inositol monophosphatase family protein [Candidatus Dormibacteria bacterium]